MSASSWPTKIIAAFRERILTVPGVGTTWPVGWSNRTPATLGDAGQYLLETIVGGPGTPASMESPALIRYAGQLLYTLYLPPDAGDFAARDLADAIATAVGTDPIPLAGAETPIMVSSATVGPLIPADEQRPLATLRVTIAYDCYAYPA